MSDRSGMGRQLYAIDGQQAQRSPIPGQIGVALAEDHAMLRRTLRSVIDRESDMAVLGESSEPAEVLTQLRRSRPDVLVLSSGMLDESCMEHVRRLRSSAPGTQIVLITMHSSRALADAALKAGAIGFVLKDRADTELGEAIRQAALGVPYRSPQVSQA